MSLMQCKNLKIPNAINNIFFDYCVLSKSIHASELLEDVNR